MPDPKPEAMSDEELRIEIATLKGWTHFHDHPLWEWVGPYGLPPGHATGGARICPDCNVPNSGCANLPMWTASIADAWPLVADMKRCDGNSNINIFIGEPTYDQVTVHYTTDQAAPGWVTYAEATVTIQIGQTIERALCRAICEAFVAWKREKGGAK